MARAPTVPELAAPGALIQFAASAASPASPGVLFITNMRPDAVRPHYGNFIQSQARSLEAAGVAVDVLYLRGYAFNRAYALALRAVRAVTAARAYDVVHVHTGHAALVALWPAPDPVVLSFVGMDVLGQPRARGFTAKSRVERAVFRQLARAATRTITKIGGDGARAAGGGAQSQPRHPQRGGRRCVRAATQGGGPPRAGLGGGREGGAFSR
jgi:hypothetical protein